MVVVVVGLDSFSQLSLVAALQLHLWWPAAAGTALPEEEGESASLVLVRWMVSLCACCRSRPGGLSFFVSCVTTRNLS
jgi:hypothetical protein